MPEAEIAQNLDALDGVDVGVQVLDAQLGLAHESREIFRQTLGQSGDEHAFASLDGAPGLANEVLHLPFRRTDDDLRVEQSGRADELLGHHGGDAQFVRGRRGGNEQRLPGDLAKLVEGLRSVIERGGQPESEIHQHLFAGPVAVGHSANLRDSHMALVDEQKKILREEIDQAERTVAALAAGEVQRVVFDAVAETHLLKHLQVVVRAHADALGFKELPLRLKLRHAQIELALDAGDGRVEFVARGDVLVGRIEVELVQLARDGTGERIHLDDALNVVAPELDAQRELAVRGHDVDHVATHPEAPAFQIVVVALIEILHEPFQEALPSDRQTGAQLDAHGREILRRSEAVDAGDGGHHDHIATRNKRTGRRDAQPLDLLVDRGILLNVRVARRHVRLGLVVIVVADEVFDGIVREEVFELGVELRGEGLVVREDQHRAVEPGDDIGHREGLAGAGDAEERLVAISRADGLDQRLDGLRLVAGGSVVGFEMKQHGWRAARILRENAAQCAPPPSRRNRRNTALRCARATQTCHDYEAADACWSCCNWSCNCVSWVW